MSVERAAKGLIKGGNVSEGLLNKVEMAFRAYDPCLGCATHALPGHMPLDVTVREADGRVMLGGAAPAVDRPAPRLRSSVKCNTERHAASSSSGVCQL